MQNHPKTCIITLKYEFFRADTDYADIAKFLGLKGNTTEALVESLAKAVYK